MPANIKAVHGSYHPLRIRNAAVNLPELAGDVREVVLQARVTQLKAIESSEAPFK